MRLFLLLSGLLILAVSVSGQDDFGGDDFDWGDDDFDFGDDDFGDNEVDEPTTRRAPATTRPTPAPRPTPRPTPRPAPAPARQTPAPRVTQRPGQGQPGQPIRRIPQTNGGTRQTFTRNGSGGNSVSPNRRTSGSFANNVNYRNIKSNGGRSGTTGTNTRTGTRTNTGGIVSRRTIFAQNQNRPTGK